MECACGVAFFAAMLSAIGNRKVQAGTVVLERVMEATATFPTEYLGEVLNDLRGRRGKVVATNQDNATAVTVTSYIPEEGLNRYGLDFRAITAGRGRVTVQLHHLSEAP